MFIENSDKMQIDEFEGKAPFYNFLTHFFIYKKDLKLRFKRNILNV